MECLFWAAEHPSYADWDVYRGRQACFLSCLDHFKAVFPNQVRRRGIPYMMN